MPMSLSTIEKEEEQLICVSTALKRNLLLLRFFLLRFYTLIILQGNYFVELQMANHLYFPKLCKSLAVQQHAYC